MNGMYNKEELLTIKDDYKRALTLVEILFKDKTDKEGKPYIGHLLRVSNKLKNKNTRIAGLLHDVVEDIPDFTYNDLRSLNFNEEIITLVKLVTKEPTTSNKTKKELYHEKITSIINSNNIEAIKLKYADMSDNLDEKRLNNLDEEIKKHLIDKYQEEIQRLKQYLIKEGKLDE